MVEGMRQTNLGEVLPQTVAAPLHAIVPEPARHGNSRFCSERSLLPHFFRLLGQGPCLSAPTALLMTLCALDGFVGACVHVKLKPTSKPQRSV